MGALTSSSNSIAGTFLLIKTEDGWILTSFENGQRGASN